MNNRGFVDILLALIVVVLVGAGAYFAFVNKDTPIPTPDPGPDTSGRTCADPSDTSCGTGYECISKCGPPVARDDDPPLGYFCQPKGYVQMCPICLAQDTLISTPV